MSGDGRPQIRRAGLADASVVMPLGDKMDERKGRGTQGADSQGRGWSDLTGADADGTAAGQTRMVVLRAVLPLVVRRARPPGTAIVL